MYLQLKFESDEATLILHGFLKGLYLSLLSDHKSSTPTKEEIAFPLHCNKTSAYVARTTSSYTAKLACLYNNTQLDP